MRLLVEAVYHVRMERLLLVVAVLLACACVAALLGVWLLAATIFYINGE